MRSSLLDGFVRRPRSTHFHLSLLAGVSSTVTLLACGGRPEPECVPECTADAIDPENDGWGWENEATCVVEGSDPSATLARCTMNPEPEPVNAPSDPIAGDVERPSESLSTGFFVSGGRLYDKNGNDFVIRGINHGHYWYRGEMNTAFGAIANTGANTVRIVWETGGSASDLRTVLRHTVDLEVVPMIELHDVTGETDNASLLAMARYYTQPSVLDVLREFEDVLLVNIANEWSGSDWVGGYDAAIAEMRNAGIHHTLVVDSNGWGQNSETLLDDGLSVLNSDPEHNVLFSVHMYQEFATDSAIRNALQGAVDQALPIIVGEFGFQHGTPVTQIPFQTILDECARLGIGYVPWSWKGNSGGVEYLDLSEDWAGNNLTRWGQNVINGSNGIRETSQMASVFLLGT